MGSTPTSSTSNVILVDMDNTLVDFDLEFGKRWVEKFPSDTLDIITNRQHFELEQNFPKHLMPAAIEIMSEPGFFISFLPKPGAIEAMKEMEAAGLQIFICTAPLPYQYETCVAEKYAWIRKWLGEDWLKKIIITRDKSMVKGVVLIDDKPKVIGRCDNPEWTHIIFEQPYNKNIEGKRLSSWKDWYEIVAPFYKL